MLLTEKEQRQKIRDQLDKSAWTQKKLIYRKPAIGSDIKPTKIGFIRWLESQDPDQFVGLSGNLMHCPLHHFVQWEYWTTPKPMWAIRFAVLLDRSLWPEKDTMVTASMALEIMRRIENEQGEAESRGKG